MPLDTVVWFKNGSDILLPKEKAGMPFTYFADLKKKSNIKALLSRNFKLTKLLAEAKVCPLDLPPTGGPSG